MPIPIAVLIAGAVASSVGLTLKKSCSHCGKYFVWNTQCDKCKKETCDDCGTKIDAVVHCGVEIDHGGWFCPDHATDIKKNKLYIERRKDLINKAKLVTHTTINYLGNSKPSKLKKTIKGIKFHEEKNMAILELQIVAAEHGCDHIAKLDIEKGHDSFGNFEYSTWRAKGEI